MLDFYQVDAFTETMFEGNPAAVFILEKAANEDWMQKVASEMNLSETAFLHKEKDGFNLRWFTPVKEVPLCGHATLASVKVLFETKLLKENEKVRFYTKSGELYAIKNNDLIELDFPAIEYKQIEITKEIKEVIKEDIIQASNTREDLLIELKSEQEVRNFTPNLDHIKNLSYRGVIITGKGLNDFDFVSRFFVPKIGINEDPVTGSAHCVLTPYWSDKTGKSVFKAYQASNRGGIVHTKLVDNRVVLSGKATMIFKGILFN